MFQIDSVELRSEAFGDRCVGDADWTRKPDQRVPRIKSNDFNHSKNTKTTKTEWPQKDRAQPRCRAIFVIIFLRFLCIFAAIPSLWLRVLVVRSLRGLAILVVN
jgi:hypothetical protein